MLACAMFFAALITFNFNALAAHTPDHHMDGQMPMTGMAMGGHGFGADPAGIMGNNMPAGAFMLNYRPMFMHMEGSRIGTNKVSPEFIVTTVPNPNGGPPTLRVVPTEMDVQMHMLMAMYAPTDWLTLMAMGSYIEKEMDHITFAGQSERRGWERSRRDRKASAIRI